MISNITLHTLPLDRTSMKKQFSLVFILFSLGFLGLNACCTKKTCEGSDDIHEIHFYNFSASDVEYITLVSYPQNSNFAVPLDSVYMFATLVDGHYSAYANNTISMERDYKVKLYNSGEVFTLSGFELEKKGCNKCFPKRPDSDLYNVLKGYSVDGQPKGGDQINIYKMN